MEHYKFLCIIYVVQHLDVLGIRGEVIIFVEESKPLTMYAEPQRQIKH